MKYYFYKIDALSEEVKNTMIDLYEKKYESNYNFSYICEKISLEEYGEILGVREWGNGIRNYSKKVLVYSKGLREISKLTICHSIVEQYSEKNMEYDKKTGIVRVVIVMETNQYISRQNLIDAYTIFNANYGEYPKSDNVALIGYLKPLKLYYLVFGGGTYAELEDDNDRIRITMQLPCLR